MTVVFYDGDCGMCQRLIQFLYFADKRKILSFAPLNGLTFKQIYGQEPANLTTVKLYHDQKTFEKSTAILKLCLLLGGFYKIFYLFIIIPAFVRDFFYDQIASRRKGGSCPYFVKDNRFLN
jgi:predicted DCC family thiol-disulfide oxidoreductase YuxK